MMAGLTVGLAVLFEAIEPDDILPVGLPVDDVARRALVESAQKAYADGGVEAVEAVIRDQLGDNADVVLDNLWDALCCSGQKHHVLSNKIMGALSEHDTLSSIFKRNDIIVQALDIGSHNGYQSWHIAYDGNIIRWLQANPYATKQEFLQQLIQIYSTDDMRRRFPQAVEMLQGLLQ